MCGQRLSGAGAAPGLPHCLCVLWEVIPPGSRVTEMRGRGRHREQQHREQGEALLAGHEPSGDRGHLLVPKEGRGMSASWKQTHSQPHIYCSPVMKLQITLPRTIAETRQCFTLGHGDASWDGLGVWRGAFPTPEHPGPCSLQARIIECLQVSVQDIHTHVLIPPENSFLGWRQSSWERKGSH